MKRTVCIAAVAAALTVCLLWHQPAGAAPLTAASAADLAQTMLKDFGAPEPITVVIKGPVTHPPSLQPVLWQVILIDGRARKYEAYLTPDGSRVTIERPDSIRRTFDGRKEKVNSDPAQTNRVKGWLAKLKTSEPTRLGAIVTNENGVCRAFFSILRNGYPFVSHVRYGYGFWFAPETGELYRFTALLNPPPVDPTAPKLSTKASALDALKRIWDTEVQPSSQYRVGYNLEGEPEIGYYRPDGENVARLVWRIPYDSYRVIPNWAVQGGSDGMLIDAVSGKRIHTQTVP